MQPLHQKLPQRGMEAFASRDFRRYQLARVMAILGAEAQAVAGAWAVLFPSLRHADELTAEALRPQAQPQETTPSR